MKFLPFDHMLEGESLKIKWRRHPNDYLILEQAPRDKVPYQWAEFPLASVLRGQEYPSLLKMEALVLDSGISPQMMYEVALAAMKSALFRAVRQLDLEPVVADRLKQLPVIRNFKPCNCRRK